jgi:hypothetical protein
MWCLNYFLIIKSIAAAAQKKEARPNLAGLLITESNTERIRWAILYTLVLPGMLTAAEIARWKQCPGYVFTGFPGAKKTTARE